MIRWGLRLDRGTQGCSSGDHWVQKLGAWGCSRFRERCKDTWKVREGSLGRDRTGDEPSAPRAHLINDARLDSLVIRENPA